MLSTKRCTILAFVVLLSAVASAAATERGFESQLFNGSNLDGWVVTGCDVRVEDGKLLLAGGNGFVRTNYRYGDFVLELDWRALKEEKWDSGIYFRADLPPQGRDWPARYQINLKQGDEGNVVKLKEASSSGLVKSGEWNHFKLTVVGSKATLEINGQPAWKTEAIEPTTGYIGFQSEVPLGGQFEFRNIKLTELDHESLFNGKDLAGWEPAQGSAEPCWTVTDGNLLCTGSKGTWLRSQAEYGDFNLRLDYKLRAAGNSGVYVRVPENGSHHGANSGIEVQLLDDTDQKYAKLKPYQYCCGLYDIAAANPRVGRPAGEWNSLEINCRGYHYQVAHNGVVVIDADVDKYPALKERLTRGYLGLQNHSEPVAFRNIRLGAAY